VRARVRRCGGTAMGGGEGSELAELRLFPNAHCDFASYKRILSSPHYPITRAIHHCTATLPPHDLTASPLLSRKNARWQLAI
jgi:hypothetical protein